MINPKDLDKNISTYDFDNHIPVPSLSYFKKTTGEDLQLALGLDAAKANAVMFSHTKDAMNILLAAKLSADRKVIEYLIATNPDHRMDFVNYVCAYVKSTLVTGDEALMETGETNDPIDSLPKVAQNAIKGTKLNIERYAARLRLDVEINYRKGY